MSSFTQPLNVEPVRTGWRTTRELVYRVGHIDSDVAIVVPTGFVTDFGTIPRIFWIVLPPHDPQYAAACVLHDYMCTSMFMHRRKIDAIFDEAMGVLGTPRWKRRLLYFGVRVYGRLKGYY